MLDGESAVDTSSGLETSSFAKATEDERKQQMTPAQILLQKLSTAPVGAAKKTGMKREHSPCYPHKRKARGKENKPGAQGTGLSVRGHGRVREPFRHVGVSVAVEDALRIFHGTRRNPKFDTRPDRDPCDERLWANFAWQYGYGTLLELIYRGQSEVRQKRTPIACRDLPRVLGQLISDYLKGTRHEQAK